MSFDYTLISIDVAKYTRILDKSLIDDLQAGGREWLTTALAVIPVWSGASHGTFLKVSHKLGMSISISSTTSFPEALGPGAGKSASAATLIGKDGLHTIEYSTSLWHLVYNEYSNANLDPGGGRLFAKLKQPGPYGFQGIGGIAFSAFAQSVKLPPVTPAIKLKKMSV